MCMNACKLEPVENSEKIYKKDEWTIGHIFGQTGGGKDCIKTKCCVKGCSCALDLTYLAALAQPSTEMK